MEEEPKKTAEPEEQISACSKCCKCGREIGKGGEPRFKAKNAIRLLNKIEAITFCFSFFISEFMLK